MTEEIPFRLAVLQNLTAAIDGEVTEANGYCHDLTDKVFRGISTYGDGEPLPMVSILEDPREPEPMHGTGDSSARGTPWRLLVQGFVEDDHENPTDPAYLLAADVQKAISKVRESDNTTLGFGPKSPCVISLKLGAPIVRPSDDISAKAYFWLPVTLSLMENLENPFTSA